MRLRSAICAVAIRLRSGCTLGALNAIVADHLVSTLLATTAGVSADKIKGNSVVKRRVNRRMNVSSPTLAASHWLTAVALRATCWLLTASALSANSVVPRLPLRTQLTCAVQRHGD